MRLNTLALLWMLPLAFACSGDDEDPVNLLRDEYEVLAIEVNPPEATPEDIVTVTVHDFNPSDYNEALPQQAPFYIWSVCLYSLGSAMQYECLDPQLEFFFSTDGPELTLDLGPNGFNLRLLLALLAQTQEELPEEVKEAQEQFGFEPPSLEEGFDLFVRLYSGLDDQPRRESVKRVRVSERDAPNQNPGAPKILAEKTEVKVGEELPLTLELAEGSAELMTNEVETLRYSWYMTAGELDRFRGTEEQLENTFMAPDEPGPARIFVFVRDQRGGVSHASLDLTIIE